MNTNFKPSFADFDGDSYSHFESTYETASKSVAPIKREISFDDKCKLLIMHTDIMGILGAVKNGLKNG